MPADDPIPTREDVLDALDNLEAAVVGDARDHIALVRRYVIAHESRAAMRELLDRVARALEAQTAPRAPAVLGWLRGIPPRDLIQLLILLAGLLGIASQMPDLDQITQLLAAMAPPPESP